MPLYRVWQFLNEISKGCYEETQKNGNKHVPYLPRNSYSKIFCKFSTLDGKLSTGRPVA